jgi:tRNA threonylcarbamoyladenosine biosynthesis protein TsaB
VSDAAITLLGLDTSLPTTSACVLRSDGAVFRSEPPPPERLLGPASHSQELLPELARLLESSGIGWQEVDSIAIGLGPGTFTGLRIGVATARAPAQALGVGLRGVSSLEALASGAASGAELERGRLVLALIDARRGQVFASLHRVGGDEPSADAVYDSGSALRLVWEPFVADPEALLSRLATLDETPVCAGDWTLKSRTELERAGAEVLPADSGLHAVDALYVCRLGLGVEPVPPDVVHPVYLRLPDAEVQRRLGISEMPGDRQE